MKKPYNEKQYERYSEFLDDMANEDTIAKNVAIYIASKEWIEAEKLTREAIDKMDERIIKEDEDMGEIPILKRIK